MSVYVLSWSYRVSKGLSVFRILFAHVELQHWSWKTIVEMFRMRKTLESYLLEKALERLNHLVNVW